VSLRWEECGRKNDHVRGKSETILKEHHKPSNYMLGTGRSVNPRESKKNDTTNYKKVHHPQLGKRGSRAGGKHRSVSLRESRSEE